MFLSGSMLSGDGEWRLLGRTPLKEIRVPYATYRWRFEKEGYETVEAGLNTGRDLRERRSSELLTRLVCGLRVWCGSWDMSIRGCRIRWRLLHRPPRGVQSALQGVRRRRRLSKPALAGNSRSSRTWKRAELGGSHGGAPGQYGPAWTVHLAGGGLSRRTGRLSGVRCELVRSGRLLPNSEDKSLPTCLALAVSYRGNRWDI